MSFVPWSFPLLRPFFCDYERAVNETFRKVDGSAFLKVASERFKDFSE
jgi:hypothetical protein